MTSTTRLLRPWRALLPPNAPARNHASLTRRRAPLARHHADVAVSEKFPKYEYVFNVCDKLAYADDVCVEGSTVCDRSTSKLTTVTVYGQAEDQTLSYEPYKGNESQKELTLAYTAGECYYRPTKATSAKIFFFCDPLAFEPQISLNYEDYLECAVEINFATVVACGTDKLKYAAWPLPPCPPLLPQARDSRVTMPAVRTRRRRNPGRRAPRGRAAPRRGSALAA